MNTNESNVNALSTAPDAVPAAPIAASAVPASVPVAEVKVTVVPAPAVAPAAAKPRKTAKKKKLPVVSAAL